MPSLVLLSCIQLVFASELAKKSFPIKRLKFIAFEKRNTNPDEIEKALAVRTFRTLLFFGVKSILANPTPKLGSKIHLSFNLLLNRYYTPMLRPIFNSCSKSKLLNRRLKGIE